MSYTPSPTNRDTKEEKFPAGIGHRMEGEIELSTLSLGSGHQPSRVTMVAHLGKIPQKSDEHLLLPQAPVPNLRTSISSYHNQQRENTVDSSALLSPSSSSDSTYPDFNSDTPLKRKRLTSYGWSSSWSAIQNTASQLLCSACWRATSSYSTKTTGPRTFYLPSHQPPPSSSFHVIAPNAVRNQKYSLLTFLPLILFHQFKLFFNLYFLLVALSQLIPSLRIGYIFTYFGPLAFVLTVTIGKEAWDDYKRYLRDNEANSQPYTILSRGKVLPSAQIAPGDVIEIKCNQRVPADCILLKTTEASGACFIRTDQLDGETDWKLRLSLSRTQKLTREDICSSSSSSLNASICVEQPIKDIHTFLGNVTWMSELQHPGVIEPLSLDNTLWANTVIASGDAVALVMYTGGETRASMNTTFTPSKVGLLDLEVNSLSKILAACMLVLSITLVALGQFEGTWGITLSRFIILFSSIIPISLRVNLDMGKTWYSFQIMRDPKIPETLVRTSTIPEELGRIEYILTDKTGTLTKNEMELKRIHMVNVTYGKESLLELSAMIAEACGRDRRRSSVILSPNGSPNAPQVLRQKRGRDIASRVKEVVLALALCHNVTRILPADEGGDATATRRQQPVSYQASSPDEIAIVKWTEEVGLTLVHRDKNQIHVQCNSTGMLYKYSILDIFPFTSERKRMGIILQRDETRDITFLLKGADVVLAKLVKSNDWLEEECGNMAREGLRTLVLARKHLTADMYAQFKSQYAQAKISMTNRNEEMQSVITTILEKDLDLLGLTGVEDRLQDGVKHALEQLRNAGIKIWVLTGDKVETATCVVISSRIVSRNQTIVTMEAVNDESTARAKLAMLRQRDNSTCLILDGQTLTTFFMYCRDDFISLAVNLSSVVCCRCSPTQKADITSLIKEFTGKRTLAIGDGGNDVSMIQAAHVGVGIVGLEGKQASLAADFSITRFSHLVQLLLWHGRNSYKRSAKLSQFIIHRGLIITVIQAIFSVINEYKAVALYQGFLVVGYATIFTMAPVFSLVLDRDISEETSSIYPELYKDLRTGDSLSYRTFFEWAVISIYQGGAIMLLAVNLFQGDPDLHTHIVAISYTALIFNEMLMVALEIQTWHPLMAISIILTILAYIGSMFVLTEYFDLAFISSAPFVWKTAIVTAVSCVPLYLIRGVHFRIAPPSYTKLEEYV